MRESMSTKDSANNVLWAAGIAAALSIATTGIVMWDIAERRSYEKNPNYIKGVVVSAGPNVYSGTFYSFEVNSYRGTTLFSLPVKDGVEALVCDAIINEGDEIKIKLNRTQNPSEGSQEISLDQIVMPSK